MKKIRVLLLLLFSVSALLFSCGNEEKNGKIEFQPLFRFQVEEGAWNNTRVAFCRKSQGFLYVHPSSDGGTGGFVSPARSISSESLIRYQGNLSFFQVKELQEDRILVLTDGGLFTVLPGDGSSQTKLPEDFQGQDAFFYDDLTLLWEKDGLVLLSPVDFKETYVLAQSSLLPDFGGVLTVSEKDKRIWYVKGTQGNYTGIGFFEYGSNLPLGDEKFQFQEYIRISEDAVLFLRRLEDGGALYLYRNFATGQIFPLTVDKAFDGVAVTPDGAVLCGVKGEENGGTVEFYSLPKGEKLGSHSVDYGIPSPHMAISSDGKTLFLVIGHEKDEILGTLDLSSYVK